MKFTHRNAVTKTEVGPELGDPGEAATLNLPAKHTQATDDTCNTVCRSSELAAINSPQQDGHDANKGAPQQTRLRTVSCPTAFRMTIGCDDYCPTSPGTIRATRPSHSTVWSIRRERIQEIRWWILDDNRFETLRLLREHFGRTRRQTVITTLMRTVLQKFDENLFIEQLT